MEEPKNWKYEIKSFANLGDISESQLIKIFDCFNHEEYQGFLSDMNEKNKKYDTHPIAKWQIQKTRDIEKMWYNKIKYTIDGDIVNVIVSFNVSFPEDFDRGDVIEWCDGFIRLTQDYMMVQSSDLKRNKVISIKEQDFLKQLVKNEKLYVEEK